MRAALLQELYLHYFYECCAMKEESRQPSLSDKRYQILDLLHRELLPETQSGNVEMELWIADPTPVEIERVMYL